jgi:hypothetical protein
MVVVCLMFLILLGLVTTLFRKSLKKTKNLHFSYFSRFLWFFFGESFFKKERLHVWLLCAWYFFVILLGLVMLKLCKENRWKLKEIFIFLIFQDWLHWFCFRKSFFNKERWDCMDCLYSCCFDLSFLIHFVRIGFV